MTPKEKAKELVDKFIAIQCALIAVDEIISIKLLWFQKDTQDLDYWQQVKQELEKL
jgi:hypothetical protein